MGIYLIELNLDNFVVVLGFVNLNNEPLDLFRYLMADRFQDLKYKKQ